MVTKDSEYALGWMVKKGAPIKSGLVFSYWQSPQPGSLMVMSWQDNPPASRSGIVDGKHGVLGAPMQMQCKETHKCNQNKISWVWVKFSKSLAESLETVDIPECPGKNPVLFIWAHYSSGLNVTVLYLISQSAMQDQWIIKESKSGKSFYKTDFFERSAKYGLLCQI